MAKKLIYFTSGLASAALLASSAYAQECGSLNNRRNELAIG